MDLRRGFGESVKAERRKRGLSQEELGVEAGLDRTYVSGLERGRRNPALLTQVSIAVALGVPLSKLVAAAEQWETRSPHS